MRTTACIENPDKVLVTITMQMTLGDWKKLRDDLGEAWPASDLARQIGDVVYKLQREFYATPDQL